MPTDRVAEEPDPRPRNPLRAVLGYGLVVALGVLLANQWLSAISQGSAAHKKVCLGLSPEPIGQPIADFSLPDLSGKVHELAQLRKDRVTLLHFWFTRCPPCIEELPSLRALQHSMKNRPFQLVTVSVDEDPKLVRPFLREHGIEDLHVLVDPAKKISANLGTTKFPDSYLIDRNGTLRYRFVNKRNWSSDLARACIESAM